MVDCENNPKIFINDKILQKVFDTLRVVKPIIGNENTLLHYKKYVHPISDGWVTFVHGAGGSSSIWHKQLREFKEHYNVLLLDLRGHGKSKLEIEGSYCFDLLTEDIVAVLDHENVQTAHFVGISIGTLLIRNLAEKYPEKVESLILGGAILNVSAMARFGIRLGTLLRKHVPFSILCSLFTFTMLPNKSHRESRLLMMRETAKMHFKEYLKWLDLILNANPILNFFLSEEITIPTLYIMGGEDYLFLPAVKKITANHKYCNLFVVEDCGHVVNVEQPKLFNSMVLGFLKGIAKPTVVAPRVIQLSTAI